MQQEITNSYIKNRLPIGGAGMFAAQIDPVSADSDLRVLERMNGSKYPMVDCHVHFVNFLQQTKGLKELIHYMDRTNILKAVVFGLPVIKQWAETEREPPEYYLDDDSPCYYYSMTDALLAEEYMKLTPEEQDRIYPCICGFDATDRNAIQHVKNIFQMYPGVFRGIGEVFFRHDDITLLSHDHAPRLNSPTIYPILEFASEYDLPILVHSNVSTTWVADYPKYLAELEGALREFSKVKIVFCHCGISRRVYAPFYKQMIERLLNEYPSLYVDFSWILFDEIICKTGTPDPEWVELAERFSDRIFLGSDVIGNFHRLGVINNRFDALLDILSVEARENICFKNAYALYGSTKNAVEEDRKR